MKQRVLRQHLGDRWWKAQESSVHGSVHGSVHDSALGAEQVLRPRSRLEVDSRHDSSAV